MSLSTHNNETHEFTLQIRLFYQRLNKLVSLCDMILTQSNWHGEGHNPIAHMNLMAGHQLNPPPTSEMNSRRRSKAVLRLSQHHVHALVFEVSVCLRSLTTTKPIVEEAPIYLEHCKVHLLTILTYINRVFHILGEVS